MSTSPHSSRTWGALAAALGLAVALLAATVPAAAAPVHKQGEKVELTGVVTDGNGTPLPGVKVVLTAARRYFSLRHLKRRDQETRRLTAVTDPRGEYTLEWPWDRAFNHFELGAAMEVNQGGKPTLHFLRRADISRKIEEKGPVVTALVIQDRGFYDAFNTFLKGLDTDDERHVYDDMGYPDEIKRVEYADRTEVSWWYFESGKMYRFRNGALEQVVPFDPVKRF